MPYVLVKQRVGDYAGWRRAFDEHREAREEAGSEGGHVFRDPEDRSTLVVFLSWEDLGRARAYMKSDEMAAELEAGGVQEDPEILYLEELGRPIA